MDTRPNTQDDGIEIPKMFKLSRRRVLGVTLLGLGIIGICRYPVRIPPSIQFVLLPIAGTVGFFTLIHKFGGLRAIIEKYDTKTLEVPLKILTGLIVIQLSVSVCRNHELLPSILRIFLPVILFGIAMYLHKRGGLSALRLGYPDETEPDDKEQQE